MNTQNVNQTYQYLIARLRAVRRTWRWLLFAEGLLKFVGILALVMAVSLVGFQLLPQRFLRIGIVLLSIGIGIYTAIRTLIQPLCRKRTDTQVAVQLESVNTNKMPAAENRLLSAVQLWETLAENRLGYAPEFVEKLILQAGREMAMIQPKQVFRSELLKIKRNAGLAVTALSLLLLTNVLLPSAFTGFAQTWKALPKTPILVFTVQIEDVYPGNTQIERGTNVSFAAKVSGQGNAPVSLYYRVGAQSEELPTNGGWQAQVNPSHVPADSAEWQSMTMERSTTDVGGSLSMKTKLKDAPPRRAQSYRATIQNVNRSLQYYIATKDVTSPHYQITVRQEPVVKQFQLRLNSPTYTQLPAQTLKVNTGDIQTLFGTEVVFTGESNKPLDSAYLAFEESEDVSLALVNRQNEAPQIQGAFIAQRSENYRIHLTDVEGFTNKDPVNYTLLVVKDATPHVDIVEPTRDSVLDDSMLVELKIEATDDYGVQALQLVFRIETEGEDAVNVPLKQWDATQKSIFLAYTWDIDRVGLFPGERIAYYVQALDTDNISGPNIGKSQTYTLRFPSLSELYDAIAAEQETEQRGVEELAVLQADATGLVDTLLDKIRKRQQLTLKDENLMQQVLETQKQIEQTAKQLLEDMKQTAKEMEKNQLFDSETLQKYQELQDLMEKALSKEHKELLRKLSDALAKQPLTEQEKAMKAANMNQEQFLQQLERAKSLYEQLLLQQELEAAAKQAKALAEQQKQLMVSLANLLPDSTDNIVGASPRARPHAGEARQESPTTKMKGLAQKEDRVGEEFDRLSEKLETLGTEMGQLAEKAESPPQIERLADEVMRLNQFAHDYKLPQTLQATSTHLRSGQSEQAQKSGSAAEQTLTELAQGLENADEFMEGANADETLTAMQAAVESGLHLSHLHEKVIHQTNDLLNAGSDDTLPSEIERLQQLAASELSTAESITQLAAQLWELGTRQMEVDPKIVWHLNASNDALSRAARALEDRQPNLAVPIQKAALADLNQAIFELLEAMAQMNQQMGAGGLENMMEQLQQLAQSQEQLNEMAQNLKQQMRQQGRTPGTLQMLRQLAAQQQLIREAAERLSFRADQMVEMLGSLSDVAEEMTEVEEALRQGTLNEQVLEQQEQILTRMLDSLKSLHKRDVGQQRKAQLAKKPSSPAQEVPPLHPELLEIVRKLETTPDAKELENIPFQYRKPLRQYFKALSRKAQ